MDFSHRRRHRHDDSSLRQLISRCNEEEEEENKAERAVDDGNPLRRALSPFNFKSTQNLLKIRREDA
jgi:hypothetical protein